MLIATHLYYHDIESQYLFMTRPNTLDHKVNQCEIINSNLPDACLHGNNPEHSQHLQYTEGQPSDIRGMEFYKTHAQQSSGPIEPT